MYVFAMSVVWCKIILTNAAHLGANKSSRVGVHDIITTANRVVFRRYNAVYLALL